MVDHTFTVTIFIVIVIFAIYQRCSVVGVKVTDTSKSGKASDLIWLSLNKWVRVNINCLRIKALKSEIHKSVYIYIYLA